VQETEITVLSSEYEQKKHHEAPTKKHIKTKMCISYQPFSFFSFNNLIIFDFDDKYVKKGKLKSKYLNRTDSFTDRMIQIHFLFIK
jgi:hypothetical protein